MGTPNTPFKMFCDDHELQRPGANLAAIYSAALFSSRGGMLLGDNCCA
jgi:hypothetical protein